MVLGYHHAHIDSIDSGHPMGLGYPMTLAKTLGLSQITAVLFHTRKEIECSITSAT